jgi:hypothetical protein
MHRQSCAGYSTTWRKITGIITTTTTITTIITNSKAAGRWFRMWSRISWAWALELELVTQELLTQGMADAVLQHILANTAKITTFQILTSHRSNTSNCQIPTLPTAIPCT